MVSVFCFSCYAEWMLEIMLYIFHFPNEISWLLPFLHFFILNFVLSYFHLDERKKRLQCRLKLTRICTSWGQGLCPWFLSILIAPLGSKTVSVTELAVKNISEGINYLKKLSRSVDHTSSQGGLSNGAGPDGLHQGNLVGFCPAQTSAAWCIFIPRGKLEVRNDMNYHFPKSVAQVTVLSPFLGVLSCWF